MVAYGPWFPAFRCTCGAAVSVRSEYEDHVDGVERAWQIRHGEGEALVTKYGPDIAEAHAHISPDQRWIWPALVGDWIAAVHEHERRTPFVRADFIASPPG
jgi:hypothetical protein